MTGDSSGPTGHPFTDVLGVLAAYAHATDDTITGSVRGDDGSRGYTVERGDVPVTIAATPADARFRVTYTFSFVDVLVEYVTEESAVLFEDGDDLDPREHSEPELRRKIAVQTLSNIADDSLATAIDYARSALADGMRCQGELLSIAVDEETYFDGVAVYDYLYPYDGGFSVAEYDRVVGRVVDEGSALAHTVTDPIEFLNSDRDDPMPSPAFQ